MHSADVYFMISTPTVRCKDKNPSGCFYTVQVCFYAFPPLARSFGVRERNESSIYFFKQLEKFILKCLFFVTLQLLYNQRYVDVVWWRKTLWSYNGSLEKRDQGSPSRKLKAFSVSVVWVAISWLVYQKNANWKIAKVVQKAVSEQVLKVSLAAVLICNVTCNSAQCKYIAILISSFSVLRNWIA